MLVTTWSGPKVVHFKDNNWTQYVSTRRLYVRNTIIRDSVNFKFVSDTITTNSHNIFHQTNMSHHHHLQNLDLFVQIVEWKRKRPAIILEYKRKNHQSRFTSNSKSWDLSRNLCQQLRKRSYPTTQQNNEMKSIFPLKRSSRI